METIVRACVTPSGTRPMSRTLAGETSFNGLLLRRTLPVPP